MTAPADAGRRGRRSTAPPARRRATRSTPTGVTENFDGGTLPEGWTVVDNIGNGQVWRFDDPGNRGNLTGGDGGVRDHGQRLLRQRSGQQDTSLVSPGDRHVVADRTRWSGFKQDYNNLGDIADVDVSVDGGDDLGRTVLQPDHRRPRAARGRRAAAAWRPASPTCRSGSTTTTPASTGGGRSTTCSSATGTCDPVRGGLVVGNVRDARPARPASTAPPSPASTSRTRRRPPRRRRTTRGWTTASTGCSRRLTGRHPFEATAEAVHVADPAGQRRRRLGDDGATSGSAAGQLTRDADQPVRRTSVLGGARQVEDVHASPTTGPRRSNVEFAEQPGGFVMQTRRRQPGRHRHRSPSRDGAPLQRDQGRRVVRRSSRPGRADRFAGRARRPARGARGPTSPTTRRR